MNSRSSRGGARGEEQFDRLAAEAAWKNVEADEAATGDAWYDEEEEAMLRQEER